MMTYILFESLRPSEDASFVIESPEKILSAYRSKDVPSLLQEVEALTTEGYRAAGFVAYEAGYAFLPGMPEMESDYPLVFFALTRSPQFVTPPVRLAESDDFHLEGLELNRDFEAYRRSIAAIKTEIENGYTYQVNYTMKYRASFSGSVKALYNKLRKRQRVHYAALIETEDWAVVSLSPELFFRKDSGQIVMKPMKGTKPRGRTTAEDLVLAEELHSSAKEQSENLMIVDLLRNDLGKICETGSIQVTAPMQVEKYETLFQMTSTVSGLLREDAHLPEIFAATFPSGSVTGAPKLKTMSIIRELEGEPRGVYTGAIGFVAGSRSVFSVAIRTLFIDKRRETLEMGVGSGILYEADPKLEYRECETKAKFLTETVSEFSLIETILWGADKGYRNLDLHLERLADSAGYFLFDFNETDIRQKLQELESVLDPSPQRVRLVFEKTGAAWFTSRPVQQWQTPVPIRFARNRTNSSDAFLYHKTTNRKHYDADFQEARNQGCFDVLFRNERDEITEGAVSNIYIKQGETLYTPPVSSGLLAGTYRKYLMERSSLAIKEKVLYERDLLQAEELFISNAIYGLLPARLLR